eukprot:NODE_3312_length_408_cov_391.367688_g2780_i0.p1 GENE.NODE_3312_length_408_cov_391.367688_g2780_i0~~NODE_3312_length_408_cov_391.367688_g2780_i0.p1  ORF type:complete len:122 (-),score=26.50 NODE_3312_length_408_cov_391.367688_g2780_i0:42-386(-)
MGGDSEVMSMVKDDIAKIPVVVFMKGKPSYPMCGISAMMIQLLREHRVKFTAYDVLVSQEVQNEMKEIYDWPTFPMLFVRGEFVGGFDIVKQLEGSGELAKMFDDCPKKKPKTE